MNDETELKTVNVLVLSCILYCPECGNSVKNADGDSVLKSEDFYRKRLVRKCRHCGRNFLVPLWLKEACR
jgi:rRNA maturation protein Nop10